MKGNLGYIYGNTAVVPEKQPFNPKKKEEYEKLRKAKVERTNRIKAAKNAKKRRVLASISIVFAVGIGLIWGEAQVYSKAQELTRIKNEIAEVHRMNDDLQLQLLKSSSLESVKESAENELKMVNPDKENIIYMDLSKNNFSKKPNDDRGSKTKDWLRRVRNLLF